MSVRGEKKAYGDKWEDKKNKTRGREKGGVKCTGSNWSLGSNTENIHLMTASDHGVR
jgi:hypothetical protein